MPYRSSIKYALLTAVILISAFILARRDDSTKINSLQPTRELIVRTSKLRHPFTTNISSDKDTPINIGDTFTLEVSLNAEKRLQGLQYDWKLPPGIVLITGATSGRLNLDPRKNNSVRATFSITSGAGGVIRFMLSDTSGVILNEQFNTQNHTQTKQELEEIQARQEELLQHPDLILPAPAATEAEQ